jgi:hypothetical protein
VTVLGKAGRNASRSKLETKPYRELGFVQSPTWDQPNDQDHPEILQPANEYGRDF